MINPNISKYVYVHVPDTVFKQDYKPKYATYQGQQLEVILRDKQVLKAGNRRLYLKYSIFSDMYYLSDRG